MISAIGWKEYNNNIWAFKGEVRTINDRNICERRSCMKNNGKSPTFKFVSGEEKRPSEVQRVSRGWCLPGATHSSADLTWIRKSLEIQAPELSEPESVELELGSCCSDLDKQVSDKICWTRMRSHFVFRPRHAPEWLRARFLPVFFLTNEEELTGKTFTTSLNTTNPNTYVKFISLFHNFNCLFFSTTVGSAYFNLTTTLMKFGIAGNQRF